MLGPLCTHCALLPSAWLVTRFVDLRDSKYPAHQEPVHWFTYPSWTALLESSRTCPLCSLIVQEVEDRARGPYTKTEQQGIRFTAFGSARLEVWCVEELKRAELSVGLDWGDVESLRGGRAGSGIV